MEMVGYALSLKGSNLPPRGKVFPTTLILVVA